MAQIDRYLSRIGFWLPYRDRASVLSDIRATLDELLANRAEALARPLTEGEIIAELRAFGRPEVVASRYTHAQPLVSAGLMPAYLRVMTISIVGVAIVQLLLAMATLVADPGEVWAPFIGRVVQGLLWTFSSITLTFAALSRICEARGAP